MRNNQFVGVKSCLVLVYRIKPKYTQRVWKLLQGTAAINKLLIQYICFLGLLLHQIRVFSGASFCPSACQSEIICISENLSTNKKWLFTTVTHSSKSLFSFAIARRGKGKAQKSKTTTKEWIDKENIYHQANDIPLPLLFIILSSTQ